jgi:hypothetical protein
VAEGDERDFFGLSIINSSGERSDHDRIVGITEG